MPAGIYRRTRSPGASVQDPVAVTDRGVQATSEQLTDFVFCSECEQRFNNNGESYVQRLVSTRNGFPLLERLNAAPHRTLGAEWRGYAERDTPDIDRIPLAYFAASVFWRASVHRWKWRDGRVVFVPIRRKSVPRSRFCFCDRGYRRNDPGHVCNAGDNGKIWPGLGLFLRRAGNCFLAHRREANAHIRA
jgi:hypothetical protein